MQLLLSTGIGYQTHTLQEMEELAVRLGYDGVEVNVPKGDDGRDTRYETLKRAEVVHALSGLYSLDDMKRSLSDAVAVAKMAGADRINVHPMPMLDGGSSNVKRGIALIQQAAQDSGLTFLYEGLVDPKGVAEERRDYFIERHAYLSMDAWVQEVIDFDLQATLDTCHVGTWGEEPADYIDRLGSRLKHVHFGDYNSQTGVEHLVAGTGEVDLKRFLKELRKSHSDISMTVELQPEDTQEAVERVARESIEFILEGWSD